MDRVRYTERSSTAPTVDLIYRPPRWLPNAHIQTIVPALLARLPRVAYRRERWNTPDGDFIELDWLDPAGFAAGSSATASAGTRSSGETRVRPMAAPESAVTDAPGGSPIPLLVLFHGLEGNSSSHYARTLMAAAAACGWRGVVPHFRSCSGPINLAPRFYHLGDSAEMDWILRRLRTSHDGPLLVAGVSLGGNVLLRWLGERRADAGHIVNAAAAISAPVDPSVGGVSLSSGFNLFYTRNFLRTLKRKAVIKAHQYPGLFDIAAALEAQDFRVFDNIVTAPLHGFRNVDDYWKRAASKPLLHDITVPTLLLNARNDPFMPAHALPAARDVSAVVELDQPEYGGHVGFMTGPFPGRLEWLAQRVLGYFQPFVW